MQQQLLLHVIKNTLCIQSFFTRQSDRLEQLLCGLTLATLKPAYRTRLTAAVYDQGVNYYRADGLFDWEKDWLAGDLPKPPARLLIGGAGKGREARHLLSQGYEVLAFDPATNVVARTLKHPGDGQYIAYLAGSYEQLSSPEDARAREFAAEVTRHTPYDGILLGWGSFTHIATQQHRQALLRRCRDLCPDGPVLLSFFMRGEQAEIRRGRAFHLGIKIGRWLGQNVDLSDESLKGDMLQSLTGFGHAFTSAEIRKLAAASGYRIKRAPKGPYRYGIFPHATFLPKKARRRASK